MVLKSCSVNELCETSLVLKKEKVPSNETPALTKSTSMGIWVLGTANQLFIRGS